MERRLDAYDLVAFIIDGRRFADDEMIITLGVTVEGKKVALPRQQPKTPRCARNFSLRS
jgi:hypothetical protein